MKPEEQIKALAELDGVTPIYFKAIDKWVAGLTTDSHIDFKPYLTSYDAIIPLAVKVCKRRKLRMVCNMGLDGTWECVITANETPNCIPCDGDFYGAGDTLVNAVKEALLRATGRWTT